MRPTAESKQSRKSQWFSYITVTILCLSQLDWPLRRPADMIIAYPARGRHIYALLCNSKITKKKRCCDLCRCWCAMNNTIYFVKTNKKLMVGPWPPPKSGKKGGHFFLLISDINGALSFPPFSSQKRISINCIFSFLVIFFPKFQIPALFYLNSF